MLVVLLQRTPAVRAIATAAEFVLSAPLGNVLRSSLAAATALGGIHTIAGATELASSTPSPAQLAVGTNTNIAFGVTGTLGDATSWNVSGSVPPGLTFQGGKTSGTINTGTLTLSGTPTTAGNYSISLVARYDPLGINSPTFNYSFNVTGPANVAPSITTQPQNQTVTAGANVTFTSGANGTPAPTFQWRKNNADINGATNSSLTLNNVQAGDAGNYTLVATNSAGTATSNAATLTVNAATSAPVITQQPSNQTVTVGNAVTFTAAASGNPAPSYQWQFNGANIGGATASTYSIGSVTANQAGTYRVVATNSAGSAQSNDATLTVNPAPVPPAFTLQPVNQTIILRRAVTFTAAASGTPAPAYQWKRNGAAIAGANGATYTIASVGVADAGTYTVVASNLAGTATSTGATLIVLTNGVPNDFNGDGQPDLLWQNTGTGQRSIWLMNGLTPTAGVDLGTLPVEWVIAGTGDFTGDGKPDLLWQNTVTGQRSLWAMNGTTAMYGIDLGTVPLDWWIAGVGDFNADGQPDILWTNTATNERAIWLMNGTTPTAGVSLGIIPFEWSIVGAADFNLDGQTDLLWSNVLTGERSIWLMNGTNATAGISLGFFTPRLQVSGTGDYNGDGYIDILVSDQVSGARSVWMMNGTAISNTVPLATVGPEWILNRPVPRRVPVDFNADSKSDIVWQNLITGERSAWLMNGTTALSGISLGTRSIDWEIAATGDFNTDGKADLVWQNTVTGERNIWLMDGGTKLSEVALPTIPVDWKLRATGDFNLDGAVDLVLQNTTTGECVVWFMSGATPTGGVSLGVQPLTMQIVGCGDFNADSKADLVWTNTATGERSIWLMNGTTMASNTSLGVVDPQWEIVGTGDFDQDGNADLVWQNTATGERSIWLMNGTSPRAGISLGSAPTYWSIRN